MVNISAEPARLPEHAGVLLASGPLDGELLPPDCAVWLRDGVPAAGAASRGLARCATVLARMPRVARSAPSEITGKMPASRHAGSMPDQS